MLTHKHSALGGALVFEMKLRTRRTRFEQSRALEALEAEAGDLDEFTVEDLKTLSWVSLHTATIEVSPDVPGLQPVAEAWQAIQDGKPLLEWGVRFLDDAPEAAWDEWLNAYTATDRAMLLPPDQRPPEALTDEERADPKS